MKNVSISCENIGLTVPNGLTHVATTWQVAKYPNFNNKYYLIKELLFSKTNILNYTLPVNVLNDDRIHFRVKWHFSNGSSSKWSKVVSQDIERDPWFEETVVIASPDIKAKICYVDNIEGELVVTIPPIRYFSGSGTHVKTHIKLIDSEENSVINEVRDGNNVEFRYPITTVTDNEAYSFSIAYEDNNGRVSNSGLLVFNTFIADSKYFLITREGNLVDNKPLYFNVEPLTTQFDGVVISVADEDTHTVALETEEQKTLVPSLFVTGLNSETIYEVNAKIKLREDDIYSPEVNVFKGIVIENKLIDIVPGFPYLDLFDYRQELSQKGLTVQSSNQLSDGTILLGKNSDNKIYRYQLIDKVLYEDKAVITLPSNEVIGIPYTNIIRLYNGDVVINYGANTSSLTNQSTVWRYYEYNPIDKVFTETHNKKDSKQWLSTAVSSSVFVDQDDIMYYVPARMVDVNKQDENLKMFKMDSSNFEVLEEIELPFTAKRHVSISMVDKYRFIVYGGSVEHTIIDRIYNWYRDNNDIYMYDIRTGVFTKVAEFPVDVPNTFYNFQGYLRRDGKITMFNSIRNGVSTGDQRTVIFNPEDNSVTLMDNDFSDNLLYRSTVTLNSGDALRISARVKDPQYVYNYISNTKTADQIGEHVGETEVIRNLVVEPGTIVNIERAQEYTSIRVLGTSDSDTGILRVQVEDTVEEYKWNDLLVTRDLTMTQAEYDMVPWRTVTILPGVMLTIEAI